MSTALRRRDLLALGSLALLPPEILRAAAALSSPAAPAPDSLLGTLGRLQRGALTAVGSAEAFLRRADELRWLHAFITIDADALLAAARQSDQRRRRGREPRGLAGILLGVKDNIGTKSLPTTAGTPGLERFRPARDAVAVQRCLAAGALLAGKTGLHELAFGGTSDNGYYGAVQNPWRRGFYPGGSSGGSAAAVAAGLVPAALGTDTLGSLRMPASLCGVVGFRPTPGRYPTAGLVPLAPTLDTPGPLAGNVPDVAWLDDVLRGARPALLKPALRGGLRIGLLEEGFAQLDTGTAAVGERGVALLRELGGEPLRVRAGDLWGASAAIAATILGYEMIGSFRDYLAAAQPPLQVEDLIARIYRDEIRSFWTEQLAKHRELEPEYLRAVTDERRRMVTGASQLFADTGVDVIAYPTTPLPARPIRENDLVEINGEQLPATFTYPRNTIFASVAGLPAVSVCAGLTADALPVGLELIGPPASDRRLLAFAALFEAARGPLPQRPAP